MRGQSLLVLGLLVAACGEDEPPPKPKTTPVAGANQPAPPPTPGGAASGGRMHVEDRVICPEIETATGPACDPNAPVCEEGLYCQPVKTGGNFCEPCAERSSIRHEFKDRDFVADQVRDPFQSFIIVQKGLETEPSKKIEGPCTRKEQFKATSFSYLELRLVGIIAQGTQRKVLMLDRGNYGHIIRRGDCVGKEKAVVKDIGPGFVTFVVNGDGDDKSLTNAPEERSVQLHPKSLQLAPDEFPDSSAPTSAAPIVAPGRK